MKPLPQDWPRIAPAIFYEQAGAAIDWLCRTFGFEVRLKVEGEDGRIEHSELEFGDGLVMVATAGVRADRPHRVPCKSPRSVGGANTQSLCLYVDDVDEHCKTARAAGAKILEEPRTDDYGEEWGSNRCYSAVDLEGHQWWFMHRVRSPQSSGG